MVSEPSYENVRIPEEFIKILSKTGVGKSIDEKVKLSLAISLFLEKTVTLEKASELSGKPLANFIEILQSKGIPWMDYTEENIEEDDFAIRKYFDELGAKDE